jgi:hypothetical protein
MGDTLLSNGLAIMSSPSISPDPTPMGFKDYVPPLLSFKSEGSLHELNKKPCKRRGCSQNYQQLTFSTYAVPKKKLLLLLILIDFVKKC